MLYTICIILVVVASVLLILSVLVQSPKSGMAANFGASNQVMGVRQTTDFLEKFTWAMALAILVFSLLATVTMNGSTISGKSSIGNDAQNLFQQQQRATTEMPATTANEQE
ncbi:MAG: preprotein translocase subunit SecG [Rikenellaceae bacterium]